MPSNFDPILVTSRMPEADPPADEIREKSLFMVSALQQWADHFLGPRLPDQEAPEDELWEEAEPDDEGLFHFELGGELPFILPEIVGPEHAFEIDEREYLLSNRMLKAYYGPGYPEDHGFQYLLVHRSGLRPALEQNELGAAHVVPLKSFVSRRFADQGDSAHAVVDAHLTEWIESFSKGLNKLVNAFRLADPLSSRRFDPVRSANSLRSLWLVVNSGLVTGHQLSVDLRQTAYMPHNNVNEDGRLIIGAVLRGEYPNKPYRLLLASAYNQLHFGSLSQSVVSLSTAMENFLSMMVDSYLRERGVSNTTMGDAFSDVTYSQLLQFHLPSMVNLPQLDDFRDVVGKVNWARKQRNAFIHTGEPTQNLTRQAVEDALNAGVTLVNFVLEQRDAEAL